jgi:hypothetical protein
LKKEGVCRFELDLGTEGKTACTIAVAGKKVPVDLPKTKGPCHFEKCCPGRWIWNIPAK